MDAQLREYDAIVGQMSNGARKWSALGRPRAKVPPQGGDREAKDEN
jgi:hypothetical protein